MKHTVKNLLRSVLILLLLWQAHIVKADTFSYVYIQGDKQVPFYVKLEGEMLPRYSKNYCIIPQLAPGPIHIQILFQQNTYPPLNFTIQVPDNGYRGFLLAKKDNAFALYDIQQRFYLLPGDAGEDHLPEMNSTPLTVSQPSVKEKADNPAPSKNKEIKNKPVAKAPVQEGQPQFMDNMELKNDHVIKTNPTPTPPAENIPEKNSKPVVSEEEQQAREAEKEYYKRKTAGQVNMADQPAVEETNVVDAMPPPVNTVSQNIPTKEETVNIANEPAVEETQNTVDPRVAEAEYYKRKAAEQVNTTPPVTTNQPVTQSARPTDYPVEEPMPKLEAPSPAIINSDCPNLVDDKKFDDIFSATRDKKDDDKRITFLMKQADAGCYTTRQSFLLAKTLEAESMRYSFLKKVFPHIVDQQNFPTLEEALFKTLEWKSYFRLIYQP